MRIGVKVAFKAHNLEEIVQINHSHFFGDIIYMVVYRSCTSKGRVQFSLSPKLLKNYFTVLLNIFRIEDTKSVILSSN